MADVDFRMGTDPEQGELSPQEAATQPEAEAVSPLLLIRHRILRRDRTPQHRHRIRIS